eukprot:6464096-Amphidinium_carterae.1
MSWLADTDSTMFFGIVNCIRAAMTWRCACLRAHANVILRSKHILMVHHLTQKDWIHCKSPVERLHLELSGHYAPKSHTLVFWFRASLEGLEQLVRLAGIE